MEFGLRGSGPRTVVVGHLVAAYGSHRGPDVLCWASRVVVQDPRIGRHGLGWQDDRRKLCSDVIWADGGDSCGRYYLAGGIVDAVLVSLP